MITLMERLGVNVVSVLIGALFFLIAIAWVEAIRTVVEYVFFHEEGIKDYHTLQKKVLAAVFISVFSGVLIIIIYTIFKNSPGSSKTEPEGNSTNGKDFPGAIILEGAEGTGGAEGTEGTEGAGGAGIETFASPVGIGAEMDDISFDNNN